MLHKHRAADLSLRRSSVCGPVGQTVSDLFLQDFRRSSSAYNRDTKSGPRPQGIVTYTVRIKSIIEFVGYRSKKRTEPQPPEYFTSTPPTNPPVSLCAFMDCVLVCVWCPALYRCTQKKKEKKTWGSLCLLPFCCYFLLLFVQRTFSSKERPYPAWSLPLFYCLLS